jgi:hypothetical protein
MQAIIKKNDVKIKIKSNVIALVILFSLSVLPSAHAADDISITYMHEGPPYWYGKGVLSSEISGDEFILDTNGVEIVSFSSGFIPTKKNGNKITFTTIGDSNVFESTFLAAKPKGHALYRLSLSLPEINKDKNLKIKIELAEKVLYSSIDFKTHVEGDFLVLETQTEIENLNIVYATRLGYPIFANMVAASFFMLALLGFLFYKRKEIKILRPLKSKLSQSESPIQLKGGEGHYELSLNLNFLSPKKILDYQKGRLFIKIPFSFLLAIFIVILFVIFIFSLLTPISKVWEQLGSFKILIIIYGAIFAIFASLFIASSKDEREMTKRVAIIGGGIIWMMFGYLGFLSIALGIITGLLIYFLSSLMLEERIE